MIYKYNLKLNTSQFLKIPKNSEILKVDCQPSYFGIMMWIYSQDHDDLVEKEFLLVGTGQEFKERHLFIYLGTVLKQAYVWHVFIRDK